MTATATCKHADDCPRPAGTGDWCKMHYERLCHTGNVGPVEPMHERTSTQSPTCVGPNEHGGEGLCGKGTVANSLCSTHNRRMTRNGTLDRTRVRSGTLCKHPDGCPRTSKRKGWCNMHADRIEQHGDPGPARPYTAEELAEAQRAAHPPTYVTCQHPGGCDRPHRSSGWCASHYQRVYKTGTAGPAAIRELGVRTPCKHDDGCDRHATNKGWCRAHQGRILRNGDPGPAKIGPRRGGPKSRTT